MKQIECWTKVSSLLLSMLCHLIFAGFLPDILKVLHALPPKRGPNGGWQGMCFSATIPPRMQQVFSHVLAKDHVSISTLDAAEPPTLAKVPQYSVIIPSVEDTFNALFALLKIEMDTSEGDPKIIVFGTTANLVALYAKAFQGLLNLEVFELHSRLSQPARTRTTGQFKEAKSGIMFASDVIGRGMDFPDVSLVLQVGVPLDADAYTHRVGRTARAGKDGRAVIMLTEIESFYLRDNRQFPIKPYPDSAHFVSATKELAPIMAKALQNTDNDAKRKAYSAYMGFMKGFCKKMQITPADLVKMCNRFAVKGMLSIDVPPMEKRTIGKMGLKGVPGIRFADVSTSSASSGKGSRNQSHGDHAPAALAPLRAGGPVKRARHQGPPDGIFVREFSNHVAESTKPRLGTNNTLEGHEGGNRGGNGRGKQTNRRRQDQRGGYGGGNQDVPPTGGRY